MTKDLLPFLSPHGWFTSPWTSMTSLSCIKKSENIDQIATSRNIGVFCTFNFFLTVCNCGRCCFYHRSNFYSRNQTDETAKNFFTFPPFNWVGSDNHTRCDYASSLHLPNESAYRLSLAVVSQFCKETSPQVSFNIKNNKATTNKGKKDFWKKKFLLYAIFSVKRGWNTSHKLPFTDLNIRFDDKLLK